MLEGLNILSVVMTWIGLSSAEKYCSNYQSL